MRFWRAEEEKQKYRRQDETGESLVLLQMETVGYYYQMLLMLVYLQRSNLSPRVLILYRTGKDGFIQVDGGAAVRGQSKGRSIMVNTNGSIYLGEDLKEKHKNKASILILWCRSRAQVPKRLTFKSHLDTWMTKHQHFK